MDLVALDIDGTIVDADDRLTDRVREAVTAVARSGIHVVLATGRSLEATLPVLDRLDLTTGYAVCSNGALTARLDPSLPQGHEVDDIVTFDPAPVLQRLRDRLPGALFAVESPDLGLRLTGPFPDGEILDTVRVTPFEELLRHPATRVVVRSPGATSEDFLSITDDLGLQGVNYAVGWSAWLDLAPQGVDKARGLRRVAQALDVAADQAMAVGDGRNDLEMFAWAGRAVAMGQAVPEVLEAADEVTAPIAEDGLATVLEGLLGAASVR